MPICDQWMLVDNMDNLPQIIARFDSLGKAVINNEIWDSIKKVSNG